jgi:hypothetical protein
MISDRGTFEYSRLCRKPYMVSDHHVLGMVESLATSNVFKGMPIATHDLDAVGNHAVAPNPQFCGWLAKIDIH